MPERTPRPYGGYFDDVVDQLDQTLAIARRAWYWTDAVEKVVVFRDELTLLRAARAPTGSCRCTARRPRPAIRAVPRRQRRALPGTRPVGNSTPCIPLLSITHNRRIRLEVAVPDADPHIPSLVAIYPTSDWHERETYDFFGIVFDGHPALTRIQMPDDWEGHPQRKDYPLGGIPVEYKGARIAPPDQRRSYN